MIQIKLSSGLGNQLFMYAFYKYIEKKYNELPYFDDRYFEWAKIERKSELSIIFPDYPIHRFFFNPAGHRKILRNLFEFKQKIFPDYKYVFEVDYDDNILYRGNVYFSGFWQTSKYVDTLDKKLFVPQEPIPPCIQYYLRLIEKSVTPISIHFRRGDYFMPKWIGRYGVCTTNYYNNAMQALSSCEDKPKTYFVFSDDIEWVKNNIIFKDDFIIVENADVNSFWYIYLMSKCHHNIISNSTFSWWGAYLNDFENKVVIGPDKWMLDSDFDLMQPNWLKISHK